MRYFRTPFITSKWSNTSDHCWRDCGLVGDHTHIFWDCPKISEYWENVQKEIKKCLCKDLPLEPLHFVLGVLPADLEENSQTFAESPSFNSKQGNHSLLAEATSPNNYTMEGKNPRHLQHGVYNSIITTESRCIPK